MAHQVNGECNRRFDTLSNDVHELRVITDENTATINKAIGGLAVIAFVLGFITTVFEIMKWGVR